MVIDSTEYFQSIFIFILVHYQSASTRIVLNPTNRTMLLINGLFSIFSSDIWYSFFNSTPLILANNFKRKDMAATEKVIDIIIANRLGLDV